MPVPLLEIEYLVVAGGGSGGGSFGSGGGAGGYLTNYGGTKVTLNKATNYTVTVGAGGVKDPTFPYNAQSGSGANSVFNSTTSTGGGGVNSGGGSNGRAGGSGGGGNGGGSGGAASPSDKVTQAVEVSARRLMPLVPAAVQAR